LTVCLSGRTRQPTVAAPACVDLMCLLSALYIYLKHAERHATLRQAVYNAIFIFIYKYMYTYCIIYTRNALSRYMYSDVMIIYECVWVQLYIIWCGYNFLFYSQPFSGSSCDVYRGLRDRRPDHTSSKYWHEGHREIATLTAI